jgi:hypothetical protein
MKRNAPQQVELLRDQLIKAVIRVGDGRGFVVETRDRERLWDRQRLVITAAHCLPTLPIAHPWSYLEERTYRKLLGPLVKAKPTVWAECLFADPIADIAVLGQPGNQALYDKADAYDALAGAAMPLSVADTPKQGRVIHPEKEIMLSTGTRCKLDDIEVPTPGQGAALLLSPGGEWVECTVERNRAWLRVVQEGLVKGGMSGSPILSMSGKAIGLMSTGSLNPVLVDALPPRIRVR